MNIRELKKADYLIVKEIYQQGMDTKNATFDTVAPNWTNWDSKFYKECRLVATDDIEVVGWAALSPVSLRPVYSGIMEVSVYVRTGKYGLGIGKKLLAELIRRSEKENIWTLYSSIFPENKGSIKIHVDLGFRKIGYREKVAKRDNIWRNTVVFERRSKIVGLD